VTLDENSESGKCQLVGHTTEGTHALNLVDMISLSFSLSLFLPIYLPLSHSFFPYACIAQQIVNHAGFPIEVFWLDMQEGVEHRRIKQTMKPIRNESETHIKSYENHQFLVKFYHNVTEKDAHTHFVKVRQ